MKLQVLLVEDDPNDMKAFLRDLPPIFEEAGVAADFHKAETFEKAAELVRDPHRRYDLILSDTYRGEQKKGDAAVIDMVNGYREGRFCPLVVFSASAKPDELKVGAFVIWADKAETDGIEKAVKRMLATGIPQAARHLHEELDRLAGSYLWEFLEQNWEKLEAGGHVGGETLGRIIRRRAALQLAELEFTEAGHAPVDEVHGVEFYMYPPVNKGQFSLGQIIRHKTNRDDFRVIATPHCFLTIQQGQACPRAEFVRVVTAVKVRDVIGNEKLTNAKAAAAEARKKKLSAWITPPSGSEVGKPAGRYWYLPAFLDIPHMYCDFLQVNSLLFADIQTNYESVAVLSPPFAESMQACLKSFDSSVGIPNIRTESVATFLD